MLQNIRSADSESTSAFLIVYTLIFLRSQNWKAFSRPVRRAALTTLSKNDQGTSALQLSLLLHRVLPNNVFVRKKDILKESTESILAQNCASSARGLSSEACTVRNGKMVNCPLLEGTN